MRFNILGPLEIHTDTGPVHVAGQRQRRILGALLLDANRPVSVDRLVDVLWGESPPRTAREQVQNCAGRLAAALPDSTALLVRRTGSYTLSVAEDAVDATAFQRAAARTGQAPGRGERASVRTELRAALDLWRGDVLSDLMTDGMRPAADRLEELRTGVVERYADAAADAGDHHLAIAELTAALHRHPYHEGLAARLMRTLHAAGRPADALAFFTTMRERLAGELGLEPGTDLVGLQRDILAAPQPHGAQPPAAQEAMRLLTEATRLLATAVRLLSPTDSAV